MIRQLRQRHRWMVCLVALAVVVLFALAIAARPDPAVQEALPEAEAREDGR